MDNFAFLGLSLHEWEVVNGFANWLVAIGTIAAVVVALRLARKQDKPRVALRAEVSWGWFAKGSEKNREYLSVSAVNVGDRPMTVSHLSLRFGSLRKVWAATKNVMFASLRYHRLKAKFVLAEVQ
jgi:hypothetical protein